MHSNLHGMKRFFHLLLIIPMLWLFHNRMANWHFHELPNGMIIEHAHPYSKVPFSSGTPSENHQHSDKEFLLLDFIFRAVLFLLTGFILFTIFSSFLKILQDKKTYHVPCPEISGLPLLRAPPRELIFYSAFY